MPRRIYILFLLLLPALGFCLASPAFALDIPITVQEPAGISRTAEQVTSGIPLPPGTQTSSWSLWSGGLEIPLQKTTLPGRIPWILLDFQVDLPASGKASLTLRDTASAVQHATPVTISEDASSIQVVTGPLKAQIGKDPFNLLDTVWLDLDGNGVFDIAEIVAGSAGSHIQVVDSSSGTTFSGAGAPDSISWEYRGPLRSTLRVDGRYRNGGTEFIAYTTRITFYAGKTYVRIEHVLRNSVQFSERHVKISSATVSVGTPGTTVRSPRPGAVSWFNAGASGVALQLVPSALWGIDTAANDGMILADMSHHGATLVVEFARSLPSGEMTRLESAANSPLFATALPSWYSQYGELSISRFGTLDDEKSTYSKWGWTWSSGQEPTDAHKPGYTIGWNAVDVHNDLEADDVWQNLIQFLRTLQRGYLDRAMGWARYYKWDYAFRTDGFDFAWDGGWEDPRNLVSRPRTAIPLTSADETYLSKMVLPGKVDVRGWGADHLFGWGLVDYYYLTGDTDALAAAQDIGEIIKRIYDWRVPGSYAMSLYGPRQGGRHLLLAIRLYEATGNAKWQAAMSQVADLWLKSPDWNTKYGQYFIPKDDSRGYPVPFISTFQSTLLTHALDRYYQVTGNTLARDRILSIANYAMAYGLHPVYQYSGSRIGNDYPSPGVVWHNYFASEPITFFDPFYTISHIDALVRGYRITGDVKYLLRAKLHWDRGSKAKYGTPIRLTATATQVGRFLNKYFSPGGNIYASNGDLPYVALLFYDAAKLSGWPGGISPAAPKGLR